MGIFSRKKDPEESNSSSLSSFTNHETSLEDNIKQDWTEVESK